MANFCLQHLQEFKCSSTFDPKRTCFQKRTCDNSQHNMPSSRLLAAILALLIFLTRRTVIDGIIGGSAYSTQPADKLVFDAVGMTTEHFFLPSDDVALRPFLTCYLSTPLFFPQASTEGEEC